MQFLKDDNEYLLHIEGVKEYLTVHKDSFRCIEGDNFDLIYFTDELALRSALVVKRAEQLWLWHYGNIISEWMLTEEEEQLMLYGAGPLCTVMGLFDPEHGQLDFYHIPNFDQQQCGIDDHNTLPYLNSNGHKLMTVLQEGKRFCGNRPNRVKLVQLNGIMPYF